MLPLITSITFKVIDPLQIKPLDITYSRGVIFQGEGHSTEQIINSAKDVILSPDANIKALAGSNGKDIVARFVNSRFKFVFKKIIVHFVSI